MRSKYLKLTERCTTLSELSRLKADVFMTGSDQVWGPTLNGKYDEAYFLPFVKESKKLRMQQVSEEQSLRMKLKTNIKNFFQNMMQLL